MNLAYVILYVRDVSASLSFYEAAFSLSRKFLHESGTYGELATGATTLSFAATELSTYSFPDGVEPPSGSGRPHPSEIAFSTSDVQSAFELAVSAGASPFVQPTLKPWGQMVAYVRDPDGHLVEICTPIG